jgi:hypothetical protein
VRSDVIVIASIGSQNAAQMLLTQDEEMIHTLAPDCSDQPFGKAILPGRGRRYRLVPNAHGSQSASDNDAINSIPIRFSMTSWLSSIMSMFTSPLLKLNHPWRQ